jgi:hypothetical protein
MAGRKIIIVGEVYDADLHVGGGPMPGGPGGPPLGTWGGDAPWPGYATPPIAPGGRPPGIWGGPGSLPPWVMPPIAPGGPGGPPLGTWGGDSPWPGYATPPIAPGGPGARPPGYPTHPIVLPPGIWPNPPEGTAPIPEHPIVIPPPAGVTGPQVEIKVGWTAQTGWFVVLVPTGEHVTPSS